jgi:hypothetical protein
LTVTVRVTKDIIASDDGFSIQLNANCPQSMGSVAVQQYGFQIKGNSIMGFIDNWSYGGEIVCDAINVDSTPLKNGIPAGYCLTIQLQYDAGGKVTGAMYQVFDQYNNSAGPKTFLVEKAGCNCTPGPSCSGYGGVTDLSPITTFMLVIVGWGDAKGANFQPGAAGSITYSVGGLDQISATMAPPPVCTEALNTLETANSFYRTLPACAAQSLTQEFFT